MRLLLRLCLAAAVLLCARTASAARLAEVRVVWSDERWGRASLGSIPQDFVGREDSAETSRELLRALVATGRVANATVRAEASGDSTRWVVTLLPRRIVERVDVTPAPLVALEGALPSLDSDVAPSDLRGIEAAIRQAYRAQAFGGTRAKVNVLPGSKDGSVRLRVELTQGTRRELSSIAFTVYGAEARDLRPFLGAYSVAKGDVPVGATLDEADRALEAAMSEAGYTEVAVSHLVTGVETEARLKVNVKAGTRTRWSFEGNTQFDEDTLRGVIAESSDKSPGNLADRLHAFYTQHGFGDAEVSVQHAALSPALVSTRFHIVEGESLRVATPEFTCLDERALRGLGNAPTDRETLVREIGSFLREDLPHTGLFSAGKERDAQFLATGLTQGARPAALSPSPESTYDEATYERALEHLKELYRAEGFFSVRVGPIERVRARCLSVDTRGRCEVDQASVPPARACLRDVHGIPVSNKELVETALCVPDVARGVHCAPTLQLRIPLDLGPRTYVSDVLLDGAHVVAPADLLRIGAVQVGVPLSSSEADAVRLRLREHYRELGYAYARVDWRSEFSIDGTRARLRFDIWEGERVTVTDIVVRGAQHTDESLVRKRIALRVGDSYRSSLVTLTREQISSLGVFNAVEVSLENADSPESKKRVVVSVRERPRWQLDPGGGFSTGEGFRIWVESPYRNLFGKAISVNASANASYLPTALIVDDTVRANFRSLGEPGFSLTERIAARFSGGLQFPDVGLGPSIRGSIDALFVNDLQRDYHISKVTLVPMLTWRPARGMQLSIGPSIERNRSEIFGGLSREELISALGAASVTANAALLVPDGESVAYGEKVSFTYDARDQSLNPTRGFFLSLAAEHVDASPIINLAAPPSCYENGTCDSHFVKLSGSASTYLPLKGKLRLAFQLRAGANVQLTSNSSTYPDRLFFAGGPDSMRAWGPSSMMPQDVADAASAAGCVANSSDAKCRALLAAVRGGNFILNPRVELRVPINEMFETVLFVDAGNHWKNPAQYPWNTGTLNLRYALGSGLRLNTPVFPISLDVGWNPSPYAWERSQTGLWAFNFAIGLY